MKTLTLGTLFSGLLAVGLCSELVTGQSRSALVERHVEAARAAARGEHVALFNRLCTQVRSIGSTQPPPAATRPAPPPRAQWHAEPAKVFDNLYFVGMADVSAWAVTTSAGIILIDALYDYSVEDEVIQGLRKLGLDPAQIKYVIVSHAHNDHVGGARLLQRRFRAKVAMSAADWDLLDRETAVAQKPIRELVIQDGQQIRLGNTTLTFYMTPGHTMGTMSMLIPVRDGARRHLVAAWGGTTFDWVEQPARYITPERPSRFWFTLYSSSAQRFRDIVAKAGADVLIANHSNFDGSKTKLPSLLTRKTSEAHPYVIGNESVQRYLTVAAECAEAGLAVAVQPSFSGR